MTNTIRTRAIALHSYRYSLLWRKWWPKEKVRLSFSVRTHWHRNCSSHCFVLTLDDFFAVI